MDDAGHLTLDQMVTEPNMWRILKKQPGPFAPAQAEQFCGLLLVYVDDLLVMGKDEVIDLLIRAVQAKWETSIPEIIDDCSGVRFLGAELFKQGDRPDLAFAITKLASMITKDPQQVIDLTKNVWHYLAGTIDHGLQFENQPGERQLNIYTDASFGEVNMGCHLVMWGNSMLLWKAGKQSVITASTAESELVEILEGALAGDAVRVVMEELLDITARAVSFTDNTAAVSIVTGDSGKEEKKSESEGNGKEKTELSKTEAVKKALKAIILFARLAKAKGDEDEKSEKEIQLWQPSFPIISFSDPMSGASLRPQFRQLLALCVLLFKVPLALRALLRLLCDLHLQRLLALRALPLLLLGDLHLQRLLALRALPMLRRRDLHLQRLMALRALLIKHFLLPRLPVRETLIQELDVEHVEPEELLFLSLQWVKNTIVTQNVGGFEMHTLCIDVRDVPHVDQCLIDQ
eukprot:s2033_g6.t1